MMLYKFVTKVLYMEVMAPKLLLYRQTRPRPLQKHVVNARR